ncbi:uncharacterized protein LOC107618339 isoform X5 [Arachis ipaensis]|nr:uncharacterized protein LOC107618339 isoform X5 [Arachis ipaensis]XP_020966463.1 uncharacterized protein LOC107618339 isoform X5 [Arachis ipaensis]XP_029151586.1 uncharacterized protein LOC112776257 isoform X3 [Arachis hypogaea]
MELGRFDPTYSSELLKHMDKQNEILMEAYRSMLHESQKLQVEEEMLMHKLYEVMSAHGLIKKAASAVASATMTPLTVEAPPNKLLVLVAKWRKMMFSKGLCRLHFATWVHWCCRLILELPSLISDPTYMIRAILRRDSSHSKQCF